MKVKTKLQRKDPSLPVYVVVPGNLVQRWNLSGTTIVEGTANGVPFGRRAIKAWGKGIEDWFVEFTSPFCKAAALNVGDDVVLELHRADTSTPDELEVLLKKSKRLASLWLALSERERRDSGEYIRAGKAHATRENRANAIVEKLQGRARK